MRTRDEVDEPEADPAIRAAEAAVLNGADCGAMARLELFEAAVQALVDLLSGRRTAAEVPPPRAGLNIRTVLPVDGSQRHPPIGGAGPVEPQGVAE